MNHSKYAAASINVAGVINHSFVNASEQPAQYDAERCNRQAVTARWLFAHPDATGYLYLEGDAAAGLDPWRVIEGVDAKRDDSAYYVEWGRTGTKEVAPNFVVFVSRKEVEKETADVIAAQEAAHRTQLAKWCMQRRISPVPSGPVVDAFVVAMGDNQYGVEETWDAFCWFRNGFQHGALYWNSITIRPVILMADGTLPKNSFADDDTICPDCPGPQACCVEGACRWGRTVKTNPA